VSAKARPAADPAGGVPVFSERLTAVLETFLQGEAPNAGRFCGNCYTPMDPQRMHCPHCRAFVKEHPPVQSVPRPVLLMFRQLRRREALVVNSFAYLGLLLSVLTFIGVFYVIFTLGANVWWFVFDIVLLFVASRVLAGLLGGFVGDELGYRYARRKLAGEWQAYESERDARHSAPL
jgi:ABC-type multidrug transport system fused ATPase/permease subunit